MKLSQELTVVADQLKKLEDDFSQHKTKELRGSIVYIFFIFAVILMVIWGIIGGFAINYGQGTTPFQKLTNAWNWFGATLVIMPILLPFVMGRERMK